MDARLLAFGSIEIDGHRYEHDVVIEDGIIRKRRKGPSKRFRARYGHTPLSPREAIPWSAPRLVVGTGVSGALPIMPEVLDEARRRGIEVVAGPTEEACRILRATGEDRVAAILHVTC
jgi:hypothetical protein